MGSYGQDEDLDEYEDDFIDDDGDAPVRRYDDEDPEEYDDDEEEEEVVEERVSEEALKLLKYRHKLKEQLRSKMRRENGGSSSKSLNQGWKPPLNNFGSFFGPSQPVIADRVVQESKALLETRHLAPKASASQNIAKRVNTPSISGPKHVISRPPIVSQAKNKVQIMKQTRDYSFLLSDDADVPRQHKDPGQQRNLALKSDSRPSQVPAQGNRPSGQSGKKVLNGYELQKPHGTSQVCSARTEPVRKLTSDNRASVVSSDTRRQLDLRKQPQPTRKLDPSSGSGSIRPPMARVLPPMKSSSSTDRRMPSTSADRGMPSSSGDRRMMPSAADRRMTSSAADKRLTSSEADRRLTSSEADRRMPLSSADRRMPSSSADRRMPSSSADRRMPSSSADRRMPSSSADRRMPSSSADRRMPSSSADRRMPSSSADRRMPSSAADRRMPSSSIDRKVSMERKAPAASVGDRVRPVAKHSLANGQRLPAEKSRAPGAIKPQDRNMSVQHSRDNMVSNRGNVAASQIQMKPPKQNPLRANLDRDHSRVQKSHGQLSVRSQSGATRKDTNNRKRKAEEDDSAFDYRSMIREMFKYNKDKYVDDDEDDIGMEVGFDTILKEESRSARIARQEDEEELEKILEEEKRERLLKKAKMRKMSQR